MKRLDLIHAAELARLSYIGPSVLPPLKDQNKKGGAQAYLLKDDVLVIPGTNEPSDWSDYNLKAFLATGGQVGWGGVNPAIATARWHFGFALHALQVLIFLGQRRPSFIIGHSLGAASAQVLGLHFQIPTVTFAAPRPAYGPTPIPGEGWVLNYVHADDVIGLILGEGAGFRRIGSVRGLIPTTATGAVHNMAQYKAALARRILERPSETHWPPL